MNADKMIVFWYFQVDDSSNDESSTGWVRYRDIEMEIIEEAYQEGKTEVFLNTYLIDLKKSIYYSKSDPAKLFRIRRVMDYQPLEHLREERFSSVYDVAMTRSYCPASAGCPFLTAWLDSPTGKRALVDFSSVIDVCADGILQEAIENKSNSVADVKLMTELLRIYKTKSWQQVTKICTQLYTRESFLYHALNTALRMNDLSKIATLGPLCYLIQYYSRTCKGFIGTVYRGVQLSSEQILTYEQAVGSWRSWPGFASTSKNRQLAEMRGNTLFIMTILDYKFRPVILGLDISEISHFPNEEEVLLSPGISFMIIDVKKDSSQKYVIELKI